MSTLTFSPAFTHDFDKLKSCFHTDKTIELAQSFAREKTGENALSNWQISWILVKTPFNYILYIVLNCFAALLNFNPIRKFSKIVQVFANHLTDDFERVKNQFYFGKKFLVPSMNEYKQELSDLYSLPSINREEVKDPDIKNLLHPLIQKIHYDRIGKGLCHGAVHWFIALVLNVNNKSPLTKENLISIAKVFENGQPLQAGLIQSFYGLENSLLDLQTLEEKSFDIDEREKFTKECLEISEGVYSIFFPSHCMSLIKFSNEIYIWNPSNGLIAVNSKTELLELTSTWLRPKNDAKNVTLCRHLLCVEKKKHPLIDFFFKKIMFY